MAHQKSRSCALGDRSIFSFSKIIVAAVNIIAVGVFDDVSTTSIFSRIHTTAFTFPTRTISPSFPRKRNISLFRDRNNDVCRRHHHPLSRLLMSVDDNSIVENDDDDDDDDGKESSSNPPSSREKSRMAEFARSFLDKVNQQDDDDDGDKSSSSTTSTRRRIPNRLDDIADATHLVAIPLDQAHELLIELESVQRAILYHCPVLVDACIPPTAIRLPLLYVQSPPPTTTSLSTNDAAVTSTIGDVVQSLVDKHIFAARDERDGDDVERGDEEDDGGEGLNNDGYRPLTLTFRSLEIDGSNNNVLNTVGVVQDFADNDYDDDEEDEEDDDVGGIFSGDSSYRRTSRLHDFVSELESTLASMGFKTAFPPDPQTQKLMTDSINNDGNDDISIDTDGRTNVSSFRPRVLIVRVVRKCQWMTLSRTTY